MSTMAAVIKDSSYLWQYTRSERDRVFGEHHMSAVLHFVWAQRYTKALSDRLIALREGYAKVQEQKKTALREKRALLLKEKIVALEEDLRDWRKRLGELERSIPVRGCRP